jgi:hypothetical protein
VTAKDTNQPPQPLTYALGPNAPAGAGLTAAGVFTWAPVPGQTPSTNLITVSVTNTCIPPLSDTKTFTVYAHPVPQRPQITSLTSLPNGAFTLTWNAEIGVQYQLQRNPNVTTTNWVNTGSALTATNTPASIRDTPVSTNQCYYRIVRIGWP